jgi:hypothetical protein
VVVLAAMLLVSDRSKGVDVLRHWRSESTSAVTLGLWADPAQREEWARALELTRGHRPALLAMCDGAAVLVPGFAPPTGGFYVPGGPLPAEVRRKAAQLAEASMIVSAFPPEWHGFARWPEIADALEGCDLVMAGRGLWVYRRAAPAGSRKGSRAEDRDALERRPALDALPGRGEAGGQGRVR